jgi:hypothetical protein
MAQAIAPNASGILKIVPKEIKTDELSEFA